MQQLEGRNTYTPTDIPHIRSNCGLALNREETLSVSGLKTLSNISNATLTGFRRFQNGTCEFPLQKPSLYYTDDHELEIVKAGNHLFGWGTLLPVLKYGVSATPCTPRRTSMKTILIAGRIVPLKTIKRYIIHLHKQTEGKIGDLQEFEWTRATLHNNIFLIAGFKDERGIPARVIERDTAFGEALGCLMCEVMACPKCRQSTDRNSYCFKCGRFVTSSRSINTLNRIAEEQERGNK